MGLDINTKKAKKNAFRIGKVRGEGASRIRVPGGYLKAEILGQVQKIAEEYGNGIVHLTTRQGFEIEGNNWRIWTKSTKCSSQSSRYWISTRKFREPAIQPRGPEMSAPA